MRIRDKWMIALCLALIACLIMPAALPVGSGFATAAQAASGVKLNKTKATIYNGRTLTLKVSGSNRKVTWSSSDDSVARVNGKGVVAAKQVGTATITAAVGAKKLTCAVTVKSPLWAGATNVSLKVGKSKKITLTYKLSGKISVKNDDASVVTCKLGKLKSGKCTLTVKAIRAGSATITITNSKTRDAVKIKVAVKGAKPVGSIVDKTEVTLKKGGSATVKVTWPYEGVPDLRWDDADVVDCAWGEWNGSGWPLTIKGKGRGTANLCFRTGDGKTVATIKVTVL